MNNTFHLYTDLAWLWPMWGDAADEYAHYCRHVTGLIRQHSTVARSNMRTSTSEPTVRERDRAGHATGVRS